MTERTCATEGCERVAVDGWQHCIDCVKHLLYGHVDKREEFVPEWRRRLTARDETGAIYNP